MPNDVRERILFRIRKHNNKKCSSKCETCSGTVDDILKIIEEEMPQERECMICDIPYTYCGCGVWNQCLSQMRQNMGVEKVGDTSNHTLNILKNKFFYMGYCDGIASILGYSLNWIRKPKHTATRRRKLARKLVHGRVRTKGWKMVGKVNNN